MPLSLPVYRLGNVWTLHTRINGKQVKRSLRTTDKHLATIRAVQLLESLLMPIPDLTDVLKAAQRQGKKYEIDLVRGIARTDGSAEDHKRMMQALKAMPKPSAPAVTSTPPPAEPNTLTLTALKEKFFSFRDHLSEATVIDYVSHPGRSYGRL